MTTIELLELLDEELDEDDEDDEELETVQIEDVAVVMGAKGDKIFFIAAQYLRVVYPSYVDISVASAAVASQSMIPPKFLVPWYALTRFWTRAGEMKS